MIRAIAERGVGALNIPVAEVMTRNVVTRARRRISSMS